MQKVSISSQENVAFYNRHDQQLIACKNDGYQEYCNQRDQQFIACKYGGWL